MIFLKSSKGMLVFIEVNLVCNVVSSIYTFVDPPRTYSLQNRLEGICGCCNFYYFCFR